MSDQALIWNSLEIAAEHCDDLVPPVYARFFVARPEVAGIFAVGPGEKPNPAMGSMINELIALIADGIDAGTLDSTIMSTLINHLGWGIDLAMYEALLISLTESVRAACGDSWTDEMTGAWQRRAALVIDSLRANNGVIDRQHAQISHDNAAPH